MDKTFYIPKGVKTYLDKPYVKVFYNPATCTLTSLWKGFSTFDEIKAVSTRILEAISIEGTCKVLYDTRQLEILDGESEKYISGTFTHLMKNAGVKYSAAVIPDDEFAQLSIDNIQKVQSNDSSTNAVYFSSMAKARQWLKHKK